MHQSTLQPTVLSFSRLVVVGAAGLRAGLRGRPFPYRPARQRAVVDDMRVRSTETQHTIDLILYREGAERGAVSP
jgi:hypothetical protein